MNLTELKTLADGGRVDETRLVPGIVGLSFAIGGHALSAQYNEAEPGKEIYALRAGYKETVAVLRAIWRGQYRSTEPTA